VIRLKLCASSESKETADQDEIWKSAAPEQTRSAGVVSTEVPVRSRFAALFAELDWWLRSAGNRDSLDAAKGPRYHDEHQIPFEEQSVNGKANRQSPQENPYPRVW
jgi:hypothetical protein